MSQKTVSIDPTKLFGVSQALKVMKTGAKTEQELHSKASEIVPVAPQDLHSKAGEVIPGDLQQLHSKAGEVLPRDLQELHSKIGGGELIGN